MCDDTVKDQGCSTCISKNFGSTEIKKNHDGKKYGKSSTTTVKNSGTQNLEINYSQITYSL